MDVDSRTLTAVEAATGLTEQPTPFDGHTFVARRNADELRYQVFRGTEVTPVGYLEAHRCGFTAGEWRLRVYDAADRLVGEPSRHGDDHPGCVHSYVNALSHLNIAAA